MVEDKRVCICLGRVIVGNHFPCEEKHILRRMQLFLKNHEYRNCYKFQSINYRVPHSQYIG